MPQPIAHYMGFKLFETTAITKQIQRRTHRKKRINKKWLKRFGYKTVLDDEKIIRVGNYLYATPNMCKKLKSLSEEMKQYKSPGKTITVPKFEFEGIDCCIEDSSVERRWEENLQRLKNGLFGEYTLAEEYPQTLLRYWKAQLDAGYPNAKENVLYFEELVRKEGKNGKS